MTPTLPEILRGEAVSLSVPMPPEAGEAYFASRLGMISTLAVLAAQEAERGAAARIWENQVLRDLFAKHARAYDDRLGGRLAPAGEAKDTDFAWSAMDAANADLRRLLIALHEAAEAANDTELDHEIIALYGQMAHARRLELG